jgi:PST family polysaccharide transporter
MERMKYITILTIISKLIFTLSIFIFVQGEEDFFIVPLLNSIGAITAGVLALYIINKDFYVKLTWQKPGTIKFYFKSGWDIFVQRFYVNLYGATNIMILGFLTNDKIVGYYSIAEKIVDIVNQFFNVVSNVYYPYFAKQFVLNPKQSLGNLKKLSFVLLVISTSAMIFVFLLDEPIARLITGSQYNQKITVILDILTSAIILFPFFSLFTNTLVAIGHAKELNLIARDTAIISLVCAPVVIILFEAEGLAYLKVSLWFMIMYRYTKIILHVKKSLDYTPI